MIKTALVNTIELNERYLIKKEMHLTNKSNNKRIIEGYLFNKQNEESTNHSMLYMKNRSRNKSKLVLKPPLYFRKKKEAFKVNNKKNNSRCIKSQSSLEMTHLSTTKQIKNPNRSFLVDKSKSILKKYSFSLKAKKEIKKTSFNVPYTIDRIDNETLKRLEYISSKCEDNKNQNNHSVDKQPVIGYSNECFFEHSFKLVKNIKSSITAIYYSTICNLFNIKDVHMFGIFNGYGPNGHLVSRDFRLYFLQHFKETIQKRQKENDILTMTSSLFYSLITNRNNDLLRKMIPYCKNATDNRIWDTHSIKSGLSVSLLFLIKRKLVSASVGNIKALLITSKEHNEREHLFFQSINDYSQFNGHSRNDNQDYEIGHQTIYSFDNPYISEISITSCHQYILMGNESILNKYTKLMFAKYINNVSMTFKKNSIELLNHLLLLYQKRSSSYLCQLRDDYCLGLILFNHSK